MVRYFDLPQYRHVRVWLDEAPPAAFSASSVVTRVVKPKVIAAATRRVAGIEMNVPHGPRASYGLLGADLVAADVDGLEVVVSVNRMGVPYSGSLALTPDDVKVGLLDEYANAVVAGISRVAEVSGLPDRTSLRFRWAAHGLVGSSPSIFENVSGVVGRLLTLPLGASDADIRALLV
jgi:hypothetical protein